MYIYRERDMHMLITIIVFSTTIMHACNQEDREEGGDRGLRGGGEDISHLYYTIPYYTILYYIILYYDIM